MDKLRFKADTRLTAVKEIKETKDWEEVNKLVQQGWILICIFPVREKMMYSLGRIDN